MSMSLWNASSQEGVCVGAKGGGGGIPVNTGGKHTLMLLNVKPLVSRS